MMTRALLFLLAAVMLLCTLNASPVVAVVDDSGKTVEFVAAVPMTEILPKKAEEGRKLFELEMPSRLRKSYLQELAEASAVEVHSIDIYGVYSDGDFLYMPTKVDFISQEDAAQFDKQLKDKALQFSNGITISDKPALVRTPKVEIVVPEEQKVEIRAVVEETRDVGTQQPAGQGNEEESLQPWQIGLISAICVAGIAVAAMMGIFVHRRHQAKKDAANSTQDESAFVENAEPVDVQCIDSAISSRVPAQATDIQPPVPPSAPPAGMVMS